MMLGFSHQQLGTLRLMNSEQALAEAEAELRRALAILHRLGDDNPDNQLVLANTLGTIGDVLSRAGQPTETCWWRSGSARAIRQKWADTQPANTSLPPGRFGGKPPRDRPASRPRKSDLPEAFAAARHRPDVAPRTC